MHKNHILRLTTGSSFIGHETYHSEIIIKNIKKKLKKIIALQKRDVFCGRYYNNEEKKLIPKYKNNIEVILNNNEISFVNNWILTVNKLLSFKLSELICDGPLTVIHYRLKEVEYELIWSILKQEYRHIENDLYNFINITIEKKTRTTTSPTRLC